jgi:hypothetical protein
MVTGTHPMSTKKEEQSQNTKLLSFWTQLDNNPSSGTPSESWVMENFYTL